MVLGFHFQGLRPSYSIAENTYEGTGTRARKGPKGSRALPSSLDGSEWHGFRPAVSGGLSARPSPLVFRVGLPWLGTRVGAAPWLTATDEALKPKGLMGLVSPIPCPATESLVKVAVESMTLKANCLEPWSKCWSTSCSGPQDCGGPVFYISGLFWVYLDNNKIIWDRRNLAVRGQT